MERICGSLYSGHISSWHDRQIQAGTEWQQEIETHLTSAHLILLLISPDFMYSDACDDEMQKALALHHAGRARALPILLRPVVYEGTSLANLQLLPVDGKPITTWPNRDEAFQQVAHSIGNIVRSLLALPPLPLLPPQTSPTQEPPGPPHPLTTPSRPLLIRTTDTDRNRPLHVQSVTHPYDARRHGIER